MRLHVGSVLLAGLGMVAAAGLYALLTLTVYLTHLAGW
jgi:hypothetical protein